ncbi:MAG TPA: efflux RND transporter periplasmic adaptor subunit [Candidatus Limnocylindrales bacterium]|nr:efflux RND transporter periplasmic adaptor subunit [Candidatus Limnocylindrales bacterium]
MVWLRCAALAAAVLVSACGGEGSSAAPMRAQDQPRPVRLVTAEAGTLPRGVIATGTLAAEDQVVLNTEVAGRLEHLPVDIGSVVKAGDVVAVLNLEDFELRVEQARTALAQARAQLGVPADGSGDAIDPEKTPLVRQARAVLDQARSQRQRVASLQPHGATSTAEVERTAADLRVAEARLQEALHEVRNRQAQVAERRAALRIAEQQLDKATLRAPFDGVVRERHLSIGAYLSVGAEVVTIVRVHPLRLRLAVPEKETGAIAVGQRVQVQLGDRTSAEGKVVRISPAVDETTRTLMVEAEIPNPAGTLRPGAFATAEIITDPDMPAVLVPASSLVVFAGVTRVLGVENGKIVEKRVRVGRKQDDRTEILEGLAAGERIVAEPGNLAAGQAVIVE